MMFLVMVEILLLLGTRSEGIEKCSQNQTCKQKWTSRFISSDLSKPMTFFLDSQALFTLSNPIISQYYNPISQVSSIPYSYSIQSKLSQCGKSNVCCKNISYEASNETVDIYSIGTTVGNSSLALSSIGNSNKIQYNQLINSTLQTPKYKITLLSPNTSLFDNKYLIKRSSKVTKQLQDKSLLIPQSFYKASYQCQFVGKMDSTVCNSKCSYIMTMQSLNQSGLYNLPDQSYQFEGKLVSTVSQFGIEVTIYDPPKIPVFTYVVSKVIKIQSQMIFSSVPNYCLNLTLVNPTDQSALSNIAISTSASNIYQKSLLFQQYQSINVSACSAENKYSVILDDENYNYQYQKPKENPTNYTLPENVQKQCKGSCLWWVWVIIAAGAAILILAVACLIRSICIRNQKKKLFLQAKLKQLAGITLSTAPSMTTLSDTTQITYMEKGKQLHSLSNSRRFLVSPRIR